jgi:hypothetical protein
MRLKLQKVAGGSGGQGKYRLGQVIDTPKGKAVVVGGDLDIDPDVKLIH